MHGKSRLVIDASVVVKWLHQEKKTSSALKILDSITSGKTVALVPDLIFYEVANALVRGIGKPLTEAQQALDILSALPWQIITPTAPLIKDAMQFAAERPKVSVYDATYVAVALYHDAVVITDDAKFHKMVGSPLTRLL